jgi:hypothetical protein
MDPITQQTALASAGGKKDPVYVDDVFSTYLYQGNGGTQSINNGIDLAGEGGLVWMKRRSGTDSHILTDTLRPNKILRSNGTAAEVSTTTTITSFNANGFSLGNPSQSGVNDNGEDIASWTFRKAPGFFDVVTYTGTGGSSNNVISHSLGSVPGMIICKNTSQASNWAVWHRTFGSNNYMNLENVNAQRTDGSNAFLSVTSTNFTLGSNGTPNDQGSTYVAYVFAHDDASFGTGGDESIIKCGNYTGTGSGSNPTISLGFEPQWVILKNTSNSSNWIMADTMRGWTSSGTSGDSITMCANLTGGEITNGGRVKVTSTGFTMDGESNVDYNTSGHNYVYMAIRRPHKPPEAATEVFAIDTAGGTSPSPPKFTSGFAVDFVLNKPAIDGSNNWLAHSRLRGKSTLYPNTSGPEDTYNTDLFDFMNGYLDNASSDVNNIAYMFKRAPSFMDVATYSGTGSNRTVTHNLASTPEFIIVKRRSSTEDWTCYHSSLGNTKYIQLNGDNKAYTQQNLWNNTDPTSTNFTVDTHARVNSSGHTYIAYLFATLPGISKVGSYSGTGNAINVDCGFTNGARFILIKRTDSSGDWYVWDTLRGIASGNDPYLLLNNTAAQVTNTDYIDPLSTGFTVTSSAPAALNASGGTYLFLAIA